MSEPKLDINELERKWNAATVGIWSPLPSFGECLGSNELWCDSLYVGMFNSPWMATKQQEANRDFCVTARNHWPAIIAALREGERLREENDAARQKDMKPE